MGKIAYSYYTDADADQVAKLMVRNKFWMGKYNPQMTGELFSDYQKKKGFVFGVVGKQGQTVVSYVAGYQLGSQRVCGSKQIIMSGLIIDRKYRTAVFSIAQMFNLLLAKVIEMGCYELIAEVGVKNFPSLYMMKKTGSVLLDNTPTVYGEVVLHNYLPAIVHATNAMELIDGAKLPKEMQPLKKTKTFQQVDYQNDRFIETAWKTDTNRYAFIIDILTGKVVGVRVFDQGFKINQSVDDAWTYSYINQKTVLSDPSENLIVNFYCNHALHSTNRYENLIEEEIMVQAPEEVDCLEFIVPDEEDRYYFFPSKDLSDSQPKRLPLLPSLEMDRESGYLTFQRGGQELFMELWPCVKSPYLEGIAGPNRNKKVEYHQTDASLSASYEGDGYNMRRQYDLAAPDRIVIKTEVQMSCEQPACPIFHFGLLDLSFTCHVRLKNGTEVTYTAKNKDKVFPELIFEDFKADACAGEWFDSIELCWGSDTYRIQTDAPAFCMVNMNYIGIQFDMSFAGKRQIRFPDLVITKCKKG